MFQEVVTIVNRTKEPLKCTYDGHEYDLVPGENPGFPKAAVMYAKAQNPVMGTEDPYNPKKFVCKLGVKDTKDDITPLEKPKKEAVERIDRSKVRGIGRRAKVLEGDPVTPMEARVAGDSFDIDGEAAARTS